MVQNRKETINNNDKPIQADLQSRSSYISAEDRRQQLLNMIPLEFSRSFVNLGLLMMDAQWRKQHHYGHPN